MRRAGGCAVALGCLMLAGTPPGLAAQEPEAAPDSVAGPDSLAAAPDSLPAVPDSVPADSLAVDTLAADSVAAVPDSTPAVPPPDTVGKPGRVPAFPARQQLPDSGFSYEAYAWGLEELLGAPSWTLIDLLTARAPGITPIRAGFFSGPHQLLDGIFAPGFVTVRRNGRELTPLESGEVDLASIPLVTLERVRVIRRASGLEIEIEEKRQADSVAYARLTSAAGDPDLQVLRGVFTNGFGRAVTIGVGIDLLNASPTGQESNQLRFWGNAAWMPFSNRWGVELEWNSESIERGAADTLNGDRRSLVLRARADLSDRIQAELTAARSDLKVEDSTLVKVDQGAFTLASSFERGYARGGVRGTTGAAYPSLVGWADGGVRIVGGLSLEVGGELASWDDFSTASARGGLALDADVGFPLQLRADAATGSRGVTQPSSDDADSVSFDGIAVSATQRLGPFVVGQRFAYQGQSRQLAFDAPFDQGLVLDVVNPSLSAVELTFSGPVIPVGALIRGWSPITLSGFFRHNLLPSGTTLIYTPENLTVARFGWTEAFFRDNLHLHLGLVWVYRSAMQSSSPGVDTPVPVGSLNQLGFDTGLRVRDFRLWFRVDNITRYTVEDIAGIPYPLSRWSIGAKWVFLN